MKLYKLVLLFLIFNSIVFVISDIPQCLSEAGKDRTYWFLNRHQKDDSYDFHYSGQDHVELRKNPTWSISKQNDQNPLYITLKKIVDDPNNNIIYYNDQYKITGKDMGLYYNPKDLFNGIGADSAHAKGIVAWDKTTNRGIHIIHSLPQFPRLWLDPANGNLLSTYFSGIFGRDWTDNGNWVRKGVLSHNQHFLCYEFNNLNSILDHLARIRANVYYFRENGFTWKNKFPKADDKPKLKIIRELDDIESYHITLDNFKNESIPLNNRAKELCRINFASANVGNNCSTQHSAQFGTGSTFGEYTIFTKWPLNKQINGIISKPNVAAKDYFKTDIWYRMCMYYTTLKAIETQQHMDGKRPELQCESSINVERSSTSHKAIDILVDLSSDAVNTNHNHNKIAYGLAPDPRYKGSIGDKDDPNLFCAGDLNRATAQERRGGGILCFGSKVLSGFFRSRISRFTIDDTFAPSDASKNAPKLFYQLDIHFKIFNRISADNSEEEVIGRQVEICNHVVSDELDIEDDLLRDIPPYIIKHGKSKLRFRALTDDPSSNYPNHNINDFKTEHPFAVKLLFSDPDVLLICGDIIEDCNMYNSLYTILKADWANDETVSKIAKLHKGQISKNLYVDNLQNMGADQILSIATFVKKHFPLFTKPLIVYYSNILNPLVDIANIHISAASPICIDEVIYQMVYHMYLNLNPNTANSNLYKGWVLAISKYLSNIYQNQLDDLIEVYEENMAQCFSILGNRYKGFNIESYLSTDSSATVRRYAGAFWDLMDKFDDPDTSNTDHLYGNVGGIDGNSKNRISTAFLIRNMLNGQIDTKDDLIDVLCSIPKKTEAFCKIQKKILYLNYIINTNPENEDEDEEDEVSESLLMLRSVFNPPNIASLLMGLNAFNTQDIQSLTPSQLSSITKALDKFITRDGANPTNLGLEILFQDPTKSLLVPLISYYSGDFIEVCSWMNTTGKSTLCRPSQIPQLIDTIQELSQFISTTSPFNIGDLRTSFFPFTPSPSHLPIDQAGLFVAVVKSKICDISIGNYDTYLQNPLSFIQTSKCIEFGPFIQSHSPKTGSTLGYQVTLTGVGFKPTMILKIDSQVTPFTFNSSSIVYVNVPAQTGKSHHITIESSWNSKLYFFYLPPVVSSVQFTLPSTVTISGSNFGTLSSMVSVSLNSLNCHVSSTTQTEIICILQSVLPRNIHLKLTVNDQNVHYQTQFVRRDKLTHPEIGHPHSMLSLNSSSIFIYGNEKVLIGSKECVLVNQSNCVIPQGNAYNTVDIDIQDDFGFDRITAASNTFEYQDMEITDLSLVYNGSTKDIIQIKGLGLGSSFEIYNQILFRGQNIQNGCKFPFSNFIECLIAKSKTTGRVRIQTNDGHVVSSPNAIGQPVINSVVYTTVGTLSTLSIIGEGFLNPLWDTVSPSESYVKLFTSSNSTITCASTQFVSEELVTCQQPSSVAMDHIELYIIGIKVTYQIPTTQISVKIYNDQNFNVNYDTNIDSLISGLTLTVKDTSISATTNSQGIATFSVPSILHDIYLTWTQFDKYYSPNQNLMIFNKDNDSGATKLVPLWSDFVSLLFLIVGNPLKVNRDVTDFRALDSTGAQVPVYISPDNSSYIVKTSNLTQYTFDCGEDFLVGTKYRPIVNPIEITKPATQPFMFQNVTCKLWFILRIGYFVDSNFDAIKSESEPYVSLPSTCQVKFTFGLNVTVLLPKPDGTYKISFNDEASLGTICTSNVFPVKPKIYLFNQTKLDIGVFTADNGVDASFISTFAQSPDWYIGESFQFPLGVFPPSYLSLLGFYRFLTSPGTPYIIKPCANCKLTFSTDVNAQGTVISPSGTTKYITSSMGTLDIQSLLFLDLLSGRKMPLYGDMIAYSDITALYANLNTPTFQFVGVNLKTEKYNSTSYVLLPKDCPPGTKAVLDTIWNGRTHNRFYHMVSYVDPVLYGITDTFNLGGVIVALTGQNLCNPNIDPKLYFNMTISPPGQAITSAHLCQDFNCGNSSVVYCLTPAQPLSTSSAVATLRSLGNIGLTSPVVSTTFSFKSRICTFGGIYSQANFSTSHVFRSLIDVSSGPISFIPRAVYCPIFCSCELFNVGGKSVSISNGRSTLESLYPFETLTLYSYRYADCASNEVVMFFPSPKNITYYKIGNYTNLGQVLGIRVPAGCQVVYTTSQGQTITLRGNYINRYFKNMNMNVISANISSITPLYPIEEGNENQPMNWISRGLEIAKAGTTVLNRLTIPNYNPTNFNTTIDADITQPYPFPSISDSSYLSTSYSWIADPQQFVDPCVVQDSNQKDIVYFLDGTKQNLYQWKDGTKTLVRSSASPYYKLACSPNRYFVLKGDTKEIEFTTTGTNYIAKQVEQVTNLVGGGTHPYVLGKNPSKTGNQIVLLKFDFDQKQFYQIALHPENTTYAAYMDTIYAVIPTNNTISVYNDGSWKQTSHLAKKVMVNPFTGLVNFLAFSNSRLRAVSLENPLTDSVEIADTGFIDFAYTKTRIYSIINYTILVRRHPGYAGSWYVRNDITITYAYTQLFGCGNSIYVILSDKLYRFND
ncbi:hypothetical protein DLAC_09814 [Tieghemostelium lacteum]|uniref:IPT/TIG domain-containing protein n=1 Tax=Tieghemostelium lacteum TaxID=361077 RepID=A0A151Z7C7_TIELA|nr:hypothetical protein DLAC_09814 [Tieghemostelium lacteum]|eukprot:KYQ89837.1 hypothetical protein DLAC_09814 [Tieghemostelium lacteum]